MARRDWFAQMLESSLDLGVQDASTLMEHAPPATLVDCLPPTHLAAILEGSLASGTMTPEHVVETAGIDILARHLPEEVVWSSISAAASGAGLADEGPATGPGREFLGGALQGGFDHGALSAEDVLRHASPSILTANLPAEHSARLLEASLAAGSMNADLVLQTLPIPILSEHLPARILWSCVSEAASSEAPASFSAEPPAEAADDPEPEPPASFSTDQVQDDETVVGLSASDAAEEEVEIAPEALAPAEEPEPEEAYDLDADDTMDEDALESLEDAELELEDDLELDGLELDSFDEVDEDSDAEVNLKASSSGAPLRTRLRSGGIAGNTLGGRARLRRKK